MSGSDGVATPQDTIERALAAARPGGETVVIADESSTANLRWAGNTLTTNGVAASRSLTVISIDRRADGTAGVGMVARSGVTQGQVEELVREAEKAAAESSAAEDAAELVSGETGFRSESSVLVRGAERPPTSGSSVPSRAARRDAAGGGGRRA